MIRKILFCILFAFGIPHWMEAQRAPFTRGVNLTNWFQVDAPRQIQFTKYTKQDFQNIKALGADVIRLPIKLHAMTNGAPSYTLDPLFLMFLDSAVTWAEELDIHLILDNHTSDGTQPTDTAIGNVLIPVWTQMAQHYKNRSRKIYYEVLNEPQGISDAKWNEIQQRVVAAIRTVDTIHTIVVGPANWNSYYNLSAMPVYSDTNLIYTFHFYDPFVFTHQGAGWTSPSLVNLQGVPFPYDAARMPVCPSDLRGTWVETSLQYYPTDGTVQKIQERINVALNFRSLRKVPIFCGEFGTLMTYAPEADRAYWYNVVRSYFDQYDIPWTIWDYQGGFGLFKKNSNELFNHDLNVQLLEALGFNIPLQTPYVRNPDSGACVIYTDYIGKGIVNSSYTAGQFDLYNTQNPAVGQFCIYWSGAQQYQALSFDFSPNKDLSYLKSSGYVLDFWVKGSGATSIDVRFVDSKTSETDHPWRMRVTLNSSVVNFNNQWQHLRIPLSNFVEHGAWDNNTWYSPQGLFDWTDVDKLEIVAEYGALTNVQLWFDEIVITQPTSVVVYEPLYIPRQYALLQNFPNPFNPITTLAFSLAGEANVTLAVYDVLGRELRTLLNERKGAGSYSAVFDGSDCASGIYIVRFSAMPVDGKEVFVQSRKILLLK
ncbi:MAG: cellulase family glycosylhydrolase [Bacteroidetes bacterium]|nr:cellulase family glycosylhydrolase [Bacteroidota bacterium]